jgi:thermitase
VSQSTTPRRWRGLRFALASALVAAALGQPSIVGAEPTNLTPGNLAPSTLDSGPIDPGLYPRADTPVQITRGSQTLAVRPLKTVKTQRGSDAVAERLLVSFNGTLTATDLADVQTKAARGGAGAARPLARVGRSYLVDVAGAQSLEAAAKAYIAADPRVRSASPDFIMHSQEIPNDPNFGLQSGMFNIQAPAAWNRTHGGGRIAVLDSGISQHPDLAAKIVTSKDFVGSPVGANDVFGHGTHVAGIAAAATNNAQGVAGVGYNAFLLNGKVLDDTGSGSMSSLASGINWATDNGANVINMSLAGSEDCSTTWYEDLFDTGRAEVRDAINRAFSNNVVLVAAAGNSGNSSQLWPAACPNVISVANTTSSDAKAPSSNFGTWVDVAAPGTSIFSTAVPGGAACQSGLVGAFANCSGTSMAAPHVAGLAALVQASCFLPNAQAVVDRITSTADQIPGTGVNWQFGRINALRAVCYPAPLLRLGTVYPTSVQLLWGDNMPGESSFQVGYRLTGTSVLAQISLPANSTSTTVSGLTTGSSYDFMVRVCDTAGCSNWSNIITTHVGYNKLSVSVSVGGKVTSTPAGINCGLSNSDCSELYAPGTVVSLLPTPYINLLKNIEYDFDHWEGSCAGAAYSCSVTMSGARSAKAVFVQVAP